jgi:hypothetical protein
MRLLSFLTRKQAWLSPVRISNELRSNGEQVSVRTVHRWFSVLREKGGFVYYPYPRANALGLEDVLLTIHGLRDPRVLGIIPFTASFNLEIGLVNCEPFVRQGYWVPATAKAEFRDFWKTAQDLDLLEDVEMYSSRNTHFVFSPFEELITEDGSAAWSRPSDNSHFKTLIMDDFRDPFEVKLSELLAETPLLIPMVVEHIWGYYSSRQVWQAVGEKDLSSVWRYAKGLRARDLRKPGGALHVLQAEWDNLLQHFEEVFVQPRVFFDWPRLKNTTFLSVVMQAPSSQEMLDAVFRMSERSIVTALKPSIELDGRCHVSCFLPSDQTAAVARIIGESHSGTTPPLIAIQDRAATLQLFQPSFCKLNWSCFEPSDLAWKFDGRGYVEQLKSLKPQSLAQSVTQRPALKLIEQPMK